MNIRQALFSCAAVCLVVPMMVFAQTPNGGLVPCGDKGEEGCQACHAVSLLNNISGWLVGVLSIAAAIMFVIAGYRLVTAGGNPSVMKSAKDMIVNVAIGFMIVLAAWLGIDLMMKTLLLDGNTSIGPWNAVSCVEQPKSGVVAGSVGTIETAIEISDSCSSVDECAQKVQECEARPGGSGEIVNQNGGMQVVCSSNSTDSGAHPPDLSAAGSCDSSTVAKYFPEQVGNAQCVIRGESVCGAKMVSTVDVLDNNKKPFSFGPMQINLTVHDLVGCGPNGSTLKCTSAFSVPKTGTRKSFRASIINEDLYQECARAAQNPTCGFTNARRIYDDAQKRLGNGWQPWSAAGKKGCKLHNYY